MGKEGVTRNLPNNAYQAATGANNPDGTNVYATLADLFQQDGLIDGSAVWSGSGFIYDVTNLLYRIGGVLYTATATQVTLTAADVTNDRIDLIVVDTAGVISVKTGVAAPAPVAPPLDVDEVLVASVFVGAGTTAPVITIEALYDENAGSPTEWIGTSDDLNVTFASVADPNTGTVSIETTSPLGSNKYIQLAKGSPYTIVSGSLDFYIKAKQAMSTPSGQLYIGFYVGGSLVGNSVYIGGSPTNIYGFDPTDTSTYQLVSIPITAFGVLPTTVDAIRFFKGPGSTTAEFFLDGVEIQEGAVAPPVAPSLPSLTNGHIWVGDASNTAVEILLSALEQNLSSVLGVGNLADLDIIIDTLSIGPGGTRQIVSNDGGVTGELTAITFLNLGGAIGDALLLGNPEFLTGPSAVGGLVGIDNFQTKMEYHLSTTTGYYTCVDANGWFFFVQGAITPRDVRFDPQVRLRMDSPDGSGSFARFITNNLTANRTYTFQDGDGTVAFLSDITGGGGASWEVEQYAYNMVPSGSLNPWNGTSVAAAGTGTLDGVFYFRSFAGVGGADGTYFNIVIPDDYTPGADLKVSLKTTINGSGGDYKFFVGFRKRETTFNRFPGNDSTTEWQSAAIAGQINWPMQTLDFVFSGTGVLPLDAVAILIYRDPGDAGDTISDTAYVNSAIVREN